jgi:hypothetical protein
MANPNVLNVSSMYVSSIYLIPTGTSATTWTGLTPASGSITKVDSISATNVTGTTATITLSINSATGGGGTAYRIAYQIAVPGNTTLMIVDKSNPIYVGESQSIVATSGTSSSIELVASIEVLT